jgi:hypothetical protein
MPGAQGLDVVYVVRPGANPELRHSLRSLAVNLPHRQVWVVGYAPTWVTGVRVVDVPQHASKAANVVANWLRALRHPDLPDEFVIMHDDMYVLQPVDQLPVLNAGPLAEHLAGMGESGYAAGVARTLALLQQMGYAEPLSFELHVPLAVCLAGWAEAVDHKRRDPRLAVRSIYGALAGLAGERVADCKARDPLDATVPTGLFASTSEHTWATSGTGRAVRAAFPEPGPYEQVVR